MMFLKFRYQLSFESVCREVADSISWQRFCRISFGSRVPHPTTLMKITTRCGDAAVTGLNQALLAKAVDAKLVKTDKVRADTTVVEADVSYPTDSGLLAKGVTRIAATIARVKAAGGATRTQATDRRRAAGRRIRAIAAKLKLRGAEQRGQAQTAVRRITGELAGLAEQAIAEAQAVVRNGRRAAKKASGQAKGRLKRAVKDLDILLQRTARVVAQTRIRLAGDTPDSATRLVSLHDPDARPIAKGRLGKPVEFGYKAQVVDNVDGIILDHSVEVGNPADGPQLVPAIDRIKQLTRKIPRAVTADRGYGDAAVQQGLEDLGVSYVAIPRKGKPSQARRQIEHRRVPREGEMAHRVRRPHQSPETQLRMEPHPTGHHRRRPNLVRTRSLHPQPGQDLQDGRLTGPRGPLRSPSDPKPERRTARASHHQISANRLLQAEVASCTARRR